VENFGPNLPGYCLKCVKCGCLILRIITEIVATRCQIFRLKCTKFHFGWGFAPDPLAGVKGPISKERERKGGEGRERKRRGGTYF